MSQALPLHQLWTGSPAKSIISLSERYILNIFTALACRHTALYFGTTFSIICRVSIE